MGVGGWRSRAVKVEHSVTVQAPPAELYPFWRDPANLPRILDFVESVEMLSDAVDDADVPNAGSLRFRPATNARGTEVRIVFEYQPPAGHLGAWIAKLVKEDPSAQVRDGLRRFKQLVETGEVVTTPGPTLGR